MSREQTLTVEPLREKVSIILRAENIACAQLWPFLKPNCEIELPR